MESEECVKGVTLDRFQMERGIAKRLNESGMRDGGVEGKNNYLKPAKMKSSENGYNKVPIYLYIRTNLL